MILALLVGLPAAAAAAAWFVRDVRVQLCGLLVVAAAHGALTAGCWWALPAPSGGGLLGLDALGLLVLSLLSVLFLMTALYSLPYLLEGTHDPTASPQRFVPALLAFLAAMSLVAVSRNLALLWAAVEATTLATAPLIYFYRRPGSLEAAWKYLLICSVGIAIALLGTFFLGVAGSAAGGRTTGLGLDELLAAAATLDRRWLRAACVLMLVGYGTKMGLAPLHTWLPDAHSQAPSPVSALLSGALLNCALLGILRLYSVAAAGGDSQFLRAPLLVLGVASLAIGAASLLGQRDYKRLLAYSSVENMGVVAVGLAVGGAATYGALLHVVNHSLLKGALFLLAGNVLRAYGTTSAAAVRGVGARLPVTAILLACGTFALGGAPPFGPFVSELSIFLAAMRGTHPWLGIGFIALLGVAFVGLAGSLLPMLHGEGEPPSDGRRERLLTIAPPLALTAAVLLLGLHVPAPLDSLLHRAAAVLEGAAPR